MDPHRRVHKDNQQPQCLSYLAKAEGVGARQTCLCAATVSVYVLILPFQHIAKLALGV